MSRPVPGRGGQGDGALKDPRHVSHAGAVLEDRKFRFYNSGFWASWLSMPPCSLSGPSLGSWRRPEGQVVTLTTPPALRSLSCHPCSGPVGDLDTVSGGHSRFESPAKPCMSREKQNTANTEHTCGSENWAQKRGAVVPPRGRARTRLRIWPG